MTTATTPRPLTPSRRTAGSGPSKPAPSRPLDISLSVWSAIAVTLASLSLAAIFDSWSWFPPVVMAVLVTIAGSVAARWAHLPMWMGPPSGFLALLLWLILLYSDGEALLRVIPTPDAILALRGHLADGARYASETGMPAEARPGLVAIAVTGVGVVAILVELCTVALHRAAVSGYPLLILAAVPMLAVDDAVPWWSFVAAAAGYLLIIAVGHAHAEHHWGATVRDSQRHPSHRRVTALLSTRSGYIVGTCGIVLAVALTAMLPGSSGQGLFGGLRALEDLGSDSGKSISTVHPFTSLRGQLGNADDTELLRVQTNDPAPAYLRLTSLDTFTGDGWTQSRLQAGDDDKISRRRSRSTGIDTRTPTVPQRTTVEIRAFADSPFLPVYANPTRVDATGDWRFDDRTDTVFSARERTSASRYDFSSSRVSYTPELLKAASKPPGTIHREFTGVNGKTRPEVADLLKDLVDGPKTQYDTVRAIDDYFDESNGFRYTERTRPGTSGDALVDFLANKEGYCEQYASAMAYLVRAAGIPARVAVGFSQGTKKRAEDGHEYYSITNHDAHAWVEVYFTGLGWVPFDPTPPDETGRSGGPGWSEREGATPSPSAPSQQTAPLTPATQGDDPNAPRPGSEYSVEPERDAAGSARDGSGSPVTTVALILAGLLGLGLLAGPAGYRVVLRRRRRRLIRETEAAEVPALGAGHPDPRQLAHAIVVKAQVISGPARAAAADAAWAELVDTAYDLGLLSRYSATRHGSSTPRNVLDELPLERLGSEARSAVEFIGTLQERARYAPNIPPTLGLDRAVTTATPALTASAGFPRRARAAAWPVSVATRRYEGTIELLRKWRARLRQLDIRSVLPTGNRNSAVKS